MATEINNISGSHIGNVGAGSQTQGNPESTANKAAADSQTQTAPSRDTVSLTPQAQQLKDLENRVSSLPEVDSDRVNAIKESIANGSYEIDANSIASKLLQFERSLG